MSTPAVASQRVFISYRREDSAAYAGRIYDAVASHYGHSNVFMDVEMEPGVDFVERIDEVVAGCSALIVVIGPGWTAAADEDGRPRLHDPGDFVRQEVSAACRREDVIVIPALVGRAQMPRAEQLPEEMRPLARRNALELSDGRWRYDIGRLTETLDAIGIHPSATAEPRTPPPTPAAVPVPPPPAPAPPPARLLLEGVLVGAGAALLGRLLNPKLVSGGDAAMANPVIRQALTFAVVGLALALWLGARTRHPGLFRLGLLGLLVGAIAGAVGAALWAFPVDPPVGDSAHDQLASERWTVVNFAASGALLGALLGALWRPPRVLAALAAGLAGGALIQLLLNAGDWNTEKMPGLAYVFGLRVAAIVAAALGAMALLDRRRAAEPTPRSSAAAS